MTDNGSHTVAHIAAKLWHMGAVVASNLSTPRLNQGFGPLWMSLVQGQNLGLVPAPTRPLQLPRDLCQLHHLDIRPSQIPPPLWPLALGPGDSWGTARTPLYRPQPSALTFSKISSSPCATRLVWAAPTSQLLALSVRLLCSSATWGV